ncbi:MAG: hypothetical protein JNJ54_05755 [Myxococcaceae bacterium]|nr:hypothetical protein [Myxococcaceae bacterium]
MEGRLLATVLFLACFALERAAWYGFRVQFHDLEAARGLGREAISQLYGQFTNLTTLL